VEDIEAVIEILRKAPSASARFTSRFVAAITRYRRGWIPARHAANLPALERAEELDLNRERHLGHLVEEDGPRSACSMRPMRSALAPVNAPRTWPKISLSKSDSGIAEEFTHEGRWERRLWRWIALAISSLPVRSPR